ncbi:unnamed protein product, partial [Tilletia laevis]
MWRKHQDDDITRLEDWQRIHPDMPVPSSLREAVAGSALAVAYDFNRDREDDLAAQAAYFPLFDYEGADDQPQPELPDRPRQEGEQQSDSRARGRSRSISSSRSSTSRESGRSRSISSSRSSTCSADMGLGMEEGLIRSDEEEFSSSDEEGTDTDDPLESRHNRDRSPPDDGDGSEFLDEVGSELLAELIGDYILGDKPTGHGGRRRNLTAVETLSLKHYRRWLRTFGTTEAYEEHAKTLREEGHEVLSLYLVKKLVASFTALQPKHVDMCKHSCIAYVGKYSDLTHCPWQRTEKDEKGKKRTFVCGESRLDEKGRPRRLYWTLPVLDRLKAMFHNPTMSQLLRYRHERLQDLQKARDTQAWDAFVFKDTVDGLNNLTLAAKGVLEEPRDIALAIATDGAQLTANKDSSVWIITAACLNTPPEVRFQRAHQFVLAIIPGPNAPGDIESFFQPILQELAQLSVGAWVWDGFTEEWFVLRAVLIGLYADQPGSSKLNKVTGTQGRRGCRLCLMEGCYGHAGGGPEDGGQQQASNGNGSTATGGDRQGSGGRQQPTGSGSSSTTAPDLSQKAGKTPYFPLTTPTSLRTLPNNRTRPSAYDPVALPLRTHAIYEDHVAEI